MSDYFLTNNLCSKRIFQFLILISLGSFSTKCRPWMQTNITDLQWTPMAVTERNRAHFRDNYNVCARMARFQKSTSCIVSEQNVFIYYFYFFAIFVKTNMAGQFHRASVLLLCIEQIHKNGEHNSCRKTRHQQKKVARCHLPMQMPAVLERRRIYAFSRAS